MKDIRPIRNEADYEWALSEIERYFDDEPELGSPGSDRFDVLAALIEAYENRTWPVELPDPIDALSSYIEQHGLTTKDLAEALGSASRASEILARKRLLNLRMIRTLNARWKIPAELLIAPYKGAAPRAQRRHP